MGHGQKWERRGPKVRGEEGRDEGEHGHHQQEHGSGEEDSTPSRHGLAVLVASGRHLFAWPERDRGCGRGCGSRVVVGRDGWVLPRLKGGVLRGGGGPGMILG